MRITSEIRIERTYRLPHPNTVDSSTFRAVALPSVSARNLDGSKVSGFGNITGSLKIALVKSDGVKSDAHRITYHMFPSTVVPFGIC